MAKLTVNQTHDLASKWVKIYVEPLNEKEIKEAKENNRKPQLIDLESMAKILVGIAIKESNLDPKAKNKYSTARGLYQMLINTQREVELKRAKLPFANAHVKSTAYTTAPVNKLLPDKILDQEYATQLAVLELLYQYKRYKDWNVAVHAYNQGSYPGSRKNDGIAYTNAVLTNIKNLPDNLALNKNYQVIETKNGKYIYNIS